MIKLLFIILLFSTSLNSKEISKVIFKVNEQIYTNIDIENRKKYLSLIEQNIINDPYRINIDTGCYFSGKLSCVCVSDFNDNRSFVSNL